MNVMELLTSAVEKNAADIFLIPGMPFSYKIGGRIIYQGDNRIMPDEMDKMITEIYGLAKNRGMDKVQSHGDDDFSFAIPGVSRFRASVFRQRVPWQESSGWCVLNCRMPDSSICRTASSAYPGLPREWSW